MRFLKYGLFISIISLALGIYYRQTYLMVCSGSSLVVLGLLYLLLGYPQRLRKKLQAKIEAGEFLTADEMSLLIQLEATEQESSPSQSQWNPFRYSYVSVDEVFLEQAEKFEKRREKKSVFVSFQAYKPTYDQMNKAQQKWYFYWRHRVRHGKYPKTSLSYIYVHAYELINGVGTTDIQDGYEQLHRLWSSYRVAHPQLDTSLLDWVVDCLVVDKLPIDPLTVYANLDPQTDLNPFQASLILPTYLGDALGQMPLSLIDALIDHNITRSKFYQAGYKETLATTLPHVLVHVDVYLRQRGKGIFERYRPKKKTAIRRVPFQSAIYDGSRHTITIAKVYLYTEHQPLRNFLTAVVKHAENLLRQKYNHRGRLQVKGLDNDIRIIIEDAMFSETAVAQPAEFQIGKSGQSTQRGVPIPPRRNKKAGPEPGDRSHLTNLMLKGFFSNGKLNFIEQARELADYREDKAKLIGFSTRSLQYNYQMMQLPQLKWYFYWRDQVRQGNYPPTDKGYLFVYLRELINNIGVEDPMVGYVQIHNIWLHYHEKYKDINSYVPRWATDYIVVNQLPFEPLHIYGQPGMLSYSLRHQPDLVVALHLERPLAKWPIDLIERLCDYRITNSPFYKAGHAELVAEYIPKTIERVEYVLKKRRGQGIFERFQPKKSETMQRVPFQDGMYEGPGKSITIATIYPYTQHQPLRDFLTLVVKYTENQLRQLTGHRGRLQVTGLDGDTTAVIDRFIDKFHKVIKPPTPTVKVEIDYSRVEQLRQESEHVFDMLQIEDEAATIESLEVEAEPQPAVEAPALTPIEPDAFEDEAWSELAARLTTPQIDALVALIIYDDPTNYIRQIAAEQHTMPTVLLDSINELAQDLIGDILIEAHPSPHIIDEYYVEMIDQVVVNRSRL